jgi:hypothetical protein
MSGSGLRKRTGNGIVENGWMRRCGIGIGSEEMVAVLDAGCWFDSGS